MAKILDQKKEKVSCGWLFLNYKVIFASFNLLKSQKA